MISGIYKIENLVNHKVYIGQSKDVMLRQKQHFNNAIKKIGKSYLYNSMKHYGVENFSFRILKETYDLDYWERFFIYWYRSTDENFGYNLTTGGQKNGRRTDNFVYTEDIKNKMSRKAKENWSDKNNHDRIVQNQNKGKQTEEFHKKRSEATLNQWKTGNMRNQAKKLSIYWMGVKKSKETRQKMKESSRLRELKHSQDYELYISLGGELNRNEFCKNYHKGINRLLEEMK